MVDVDIGIKRTANLPLSIREKLLVVMANVDIYPIPSTLNPIAQVTIVDCCIYLVLIDMWMVAFMKMKEVIVGMMVQDLEVCLNISVTLPFAIMYKVLMVMGEADLGLIPSLLPKIIQVCLVYHWYFIVILTREVVIGIRPENFFT